MNYFDRLMFEYYKVLNNSWKKEIKNSAKQAIQMLSDIPKSERLHKRHIDDIMSVINSMRRLFIACKAGYESIHTKKSYAWS